MRGKALKFVSILGGVVGVIVIALGAKTLVDTSTGPPPPKPYDVAMYDVYSALIPNIEQSWLPRLIDRPSDFRPEEVLIGVETLTFQCCSVFDGAAEPPSFAGLVTDKRLKQAAESAIADYSKRNANMLELQRKFNLPHYYLFTKAEQQSTSNAAACLAFQQKHPGYERWIELSAVGFNQDQTVAVVYLVETRATKDFCIVWTSKTGEGRMLQNLGGKWQLNPVGFSVSLGDLLQ